MSKFAIVTGASTGIGRAVAPEKIAEAVVNLCANKNLKSSGKIFVVKKGQEIFEAFHH